MKEYNSTRYYKELNGKKVICVDFDNTICLDEWPYVGPALLGASKVLNELVRHGHRLILLTQRTKDYPICCEELEKYARDVNDIRVSVDGDTVTDILSDAIESCNEHNFTFASYNKNIDWEMMTHDYGRKVYADYYIDDHNVGMKYVIVRNKFGEMCKVCDWRFIDEWFVNEGLYPERVYY